MLLLLLFLRQKSSDILTRRLMNQESPRKAQFFATQVPKLMNTHQATYDQALMRLLLDVVECGVVGCGQSVHYYVDCLGGSSKLTNDYTISRL